MSGLSKIVKKIGMNCAKQKLCQNQRQFRYFFKISVCVKDEIQPGNPEQNICFSIEIVSLSVRYLRFRSESLF